MVKQVIVMRTDLNMRKGKMIVQACHASMKVILDMMKTNYFPNVFVEKYLSYRMDSPIQIWLDGLFTKICVGCDSEGELLKYYSLAKSKGILCSLITDSGLTEFHNIPTNTCIAIGPDLSEVIDEITGHLKLL
jgi:PTH2 family peptidyl-tRNA hydrolase